MRGTASRWPGLFPAWLADDIDTLCPWLPILSTCGTRVLIEVTRFSLASWSFGDCLNRGGGCTRSSPSVEGWRSRVPGTASGAAPLPHLQPGSDPSLSLAWSPLTAHGDWCCVLYGLLFLAAQTISEDGTHCVDEPGKRMATWVQFLLRGWKAWGFRHEHSQPGARCGAQPLSPERGGRGSLPRGMGRRRQEAQLGQVFRSAGPAASRSPAGTPATAGSQARE